MGIFGSIGKQFDSMSAQQQKAQKMQDAQAQQMQQAQQLFGGQIGGGAFIQQAQQQEYEQPQYANPFASIFGQISQVATPQQQKDFRKFEQYQVTMCLEHCQKKERNYTAEYELCLSKCFDTAFIYTRVGLNELNQFAFENKIQS